MYFSIMKFNTLFPPSCQKPGLHIPRQTAASELCKRVAAVIREYTWHCNMETTRKWLFWKGQMSHRFATASVSDICGTTVILMGQIGEDRRTLHYPCRTFPFLGIRVSTTTSSCSRRAYESWWEWAASVPTRLRLAECFATHRQYIATGMCSSTLTAFPASESSGKLSKTATVWGHKQSMKRCCLRKNVRTQLESRQEVSKAIPNVLFFQNNGCIVEVIVVDRNEKPTRPHLLEVGKIRGFSENTV